MSEPRLSQNEIAKFIASVIGPLLTLGIPQADIRLAMKWVVEKDELWQALPTLVNQTEAVGRGVINELRHQSKAAEASRKPS
jgi:hypothetical protein